MEPLTVNSADPTPQQPLGSGAELAARRACDPAIGNRFISLLNDDPSGAQSSEQTLPDSPGLGDEESAAQPLAVTGSPADVATDPVVPRGFAPSALTVTTDAAPSSSPAAGKEGNDADRGHVDQKSAIHMTALAFPLPVSVTLMMSQAMAGGDSNPSGGAPVLDDHRLQALLQQLCSGVYIAAETSANGSRMLLALDAALPAASVELVRESTYLRVRLQARDDASLRSMAAQRDALQTALGDATHLQVSVEIVGQEEI
jgi:hypothetical protein